MKKYKSLYEEKNYSDDELRREVMITTGNSQPLTKKDLKGLRVLLKKYNNNLSRALDEFIE